MQSVTDLSDLGYQDLLLSKAKTLCLKETSFVYSPGWEYTLWEVVMGKKRIKNIGFDTMSMLLFYSNSSKSWIAHNGDEYITITIDEWLEKLRERREND